MSDWDYRYQTRTQVASFPDNEIISLVSKYASKDLTTKPKALDLGCGIGDHFNFIVSKGFQYVGIDSSKIAINLANEEYGKGKEIFIEGDIARLPFLDSYFDLIVDRQTLDQLQTHVIPIVIKEVHRVLKPSGLYIGVNLGGNDSRVDHATIKKNKKSGEPQNMIGVKTFFSASSIATFFQDFILEEMFEIKKKDLVRGDLVEQLSFVYRKRP